MGAGARSAARGRGSPLGRALATAVGRDLPAPEVFHEIHEYVSSATVVLSYCKWRGRPRSCSPLAIQEREWD